MALGDIGAAIRIDKSVDSVASAVSCIMDGSTVMIGGFGGSGVPEALIQGLVLLGARDLTLITNNAGSGEDGIAALFREGLVRRIICSYPRSTGSIWFERQFVAGAVELELVPQGTLSEQIRAGGAGIPAFYTPTSVGTALAEGKEVRDIGGREYVLEHALRADVALIRARAADRWGNLVYRNVARNYGPSMATAAETTVAEVEEIVELGSLDPESIVTPGIYVQRVFCDTPKESLE
jgi:3-oxoadipate CoA-transferase alpha subunit